LCGATRGNDEDDDGHDGARGMISAFEGYLVSDTTIKLRWQERGAVASVCRRNGMSGVDGASTNDTTTKQSDNKRVTA